MHPALLVGLLMAKKAVAYSAYRALQKYGFPRAYRRLLEANKQLTPPAHRVAVGRAVRTAFVLPGAAADVIVDNEPARAFLASFARTQAAAAGWTGWTARALAQADTPAALRAVLAEMAKLVGKK